MKVNFDMDLTEHCSHECFQILVHDLKQNRDTKSDKIHSVNFKMKVL